MSNATFDDGTTASVTLKRLAAQHVGADVFLADTRLSSAFSIARTPIDDFLRATPTGATLDARQLHAGATATAIATGRIFREKRLTAQVRRAMESRTGIRSLVETPTFESQFQPSWANNCLPQSLEATTGPVAYLVDLYRKAMALEASGDASRTIALSARRPDLERMLLDSPAVNRLKPVIGTVNDILEAAIQSSLGGSGIPVEDALIQARYPMVLPYERYQEQITHFLGKKGYSLGDIIRLVDADYPYFVQKGMRGANADNALQADTGLGPVQQEMLTEASYGAATRGQTERTNPRTLLRTKFLQDASDFLKRFYNAATVAELENTTVFCRRAGITKAQLESLLSIERYTPTLSPNVRGFAAPSPSTFGSAYINAGKAQPISVSTSPEGELHTLVGLTTQRLDRIQRLVRLSRWLNLSFDQTDQILCACRRAEGRHDNEEQSENTVRCLGLFRYLQRFATITPEDFASLIDAPSVYGRGDIPCHFDRIFNADRLFASPLVIDDTLFNIVPADDAESRKIDQFCSALGISFETYLYLAHFIHAASDDGKFRAGAMENAEQLRWSLETVAAFYRMTKIPNYLGVSPIEAIALLHILNQRGVQFVGRLCRSVLFSSQQSELCDTVTVVQALAEIIDWCRKHDLSIHWLHQQVTPIAPNATATAREIGLLTTINTRMRATLVSEGTFVDAALPAYVNDAGATPIRWMDELDYFVGSDGLIKEAQGIAGPVQYEEILRSIINNRLTEMNLYTVENSVKLMRIVLDAKAAQQALIWESLGSSFDCSAEQSQELLRWAGGNTYDLLKEVYNVFAISPADAPLVVNIGDDILRTLARIGVRADVARKLSISAYALRTYVDHPDWFVPGGELEKIDVSFRHFHSLVEYQDMVRDVREDEQRVLDYFYLVNNLRGDLSPEDMALIRDDAAGRIAAFSGFSIREVLEIADQVSPDSVIRSVPGLSRLLRMRRLCDRLSMGAAELVRLARLTPLTPVETFRAAAEGAINAMTYMRVISRDKEDGEMGQSEWSNIVTDTETIIARSTDTARLTLTVRNFLGQPLRNIRVSWTTSLGMLDVPDSDRTNEFGQVSIDLLAGMEMGAAQVIAEFGLARRIVAPSVVIGCDETTLRIIADPDTPDPEQTLAGNIGQIKFGAALRDAHGNPGRDRVVQWSADLPSSTFLRPQTRCDENGTTVAYLRSLSSGVASARMEIVANGESLSFAPVKFEDRPWFRYLRFARTLVETEGTEVTAQLVQLDGSSLPDVEVIFATEPENGRFIPATAVTDADGIARSTYTPESAGTMTVKCATTLENEPASLSQSGIVVHAMPKLVAWSPDSEAEYWLDQPEPCQFSITLEPKTEGLPVEWLLDGVRKTTSYTDDSGTAYFELHFRASELGNRKIEARSVSVKVSHVFDVHVGIVHDRIDLVSDTPASLVAERLKERVGIYIDKGQSGRLLIKAMKDQEADPDASVTVRLAPGQLDPIARNIRITPPLGSTIDADEDGNCTMLIDCTQTHDYPVSHNDQNVIGLIVSTNRRIELAAYLAPRLFVKRAYIITYHQLDDVKILTTSIMVAAPRSDDSDIPKAIAGLMRVGKQSVTEQPFTAAGSYSDSSGARLSFNVALPPNGYANGCAFVVRSNDAQLLYTDIPITDPALPADAVKYYHTWEYTPPPPPVAK